MISHFDKYGLDKDDIKKIINDELNKNADILIGVDDEEVNELINILVDAIAKTIESNNEELAGNIKNYIDEKFKEHNENHASAKRGLF